MTHRLGVAGVGAHGIALALGALLMVAFAARRFAPVPDLVLIMAVFGALRHGPWAGAALGLTGGWLLDLFPPGSQLPGSLALLYAASGALIGRLRRDGPIPLIVAVGATGMAAVLVAGGRAVFALSAGTPACWGPLALRALATTVAAVVVMPLLFWLEAHGRHRRGR